LCIHSSCTCWMPAVCEVGTRWIVDGPSHEVTHSNGGSSRAGDSQREDLTWPEEVPESFLYVIMPD
jgi:hypothetical protein